MFYRYRLALGEGTGCSDVAMCCLGPGQIQGALTQCSGIGELGIPVGEQGKPLEDKLVLLSFPRRVHMS